MFAVVIGLPCKFSTQDQPQLPAQRFVLLILNIFFKLFFLSGQFVVFDHPKFGLIPCISTIADIEEGEEVIKIIFYSSLPQTYYNMKNEFSDTISLEHRSLWGTGTTWRSPPSGTSWPGSTASSGRRASSTRTGWSAPSENQFLHSVLTGARSFGLCMIQNKLPRVQ